MPLKVTIDQRLEIDDMYAMGMPTHEIASKYNVHPATILLYVTHKAKMKSKRIKAKTKKYVTDDDVIKMRELFSLGFDYPKIAELTKFSVGSVMSNVISGAYDLKSPNEKRNIVTKLDFKQFILPEHPILRNAPTHIDMCNPTTDEKAFDYMINKF
jgi:hypothetical protein